jgi:hypothetical protein
VDTEAEDHAGDETRYACMSRPYVRTKEKEPKGKTIQDMTLNELWEAHEKFVREPERI